MRFDRAFELACACCKADGADVPEVQAVIQLLLPGVRSAWGALLYQMTSRAERLLQQIAADDPRPTPEQVAALLLSLWQSVALQPLPAALVDQARAAAGSLGAAARLRSGLPRASALGQSQVLGADRLAVSLQGLADGLAQTASLEASRISLDPLKAGLTQETLDALRQELGQALGSGAALQPVLDSWAYQTFNMATIRAAAAEGEGFIQIVARIDTRTTTFCRLVNGRVILIGRALAQLDRIDAAIQARDIDALKAAAPFIRDPQNATLADVQAVLDMGGLPPYHFGCRTQAIPVRLS